LSETSYDTDTEMIAAAALPGLIEKTSPRVKSPSKGNVTNINSFLIAN